MDELPLGACERMIRKAIGLRVGRMLQKLWLSTLKR
jgi:hypothetical protein